ncbi:MAG: CDP-alcohol phosphatidyltransferase family protein [Bacteroidales bacterium]|nr:CDP-alcohol phosphatidyltransferase family protein [Bacteroidales bacterium]
MKKNIPNLITCMNIICGAISMVMSLHFGFLKLAALFIIIAALFDFCDGFTARLLKVQSPMGVDLDSLADVFSFGGAPAMIIFVWLEQCLVNLPPSLATHQWMQLLPYLAFLIPAFSAYRLAKFNHDDRQHTDFYGLPTPANALFIGFLPLSADKLPFVNNFWVVLVLMLVFCFLLVSDLPMFSLKFKHFRWKDNEVRYSFIILAVILFAFFRLGSFPIIILSYLLISVTIFTIHKIQLL